MMKKILIFTGLFIIIGLNAMGQPGTINYLAEKQGFKVFKLGDPISKYTQYLELVRTIDEARKDYVVTDSSLLSVGNSIKINMITVSTYKDAIESISVFVDKDNNREFLNTLQGAHGIGNRSPHYIYVDQWMSDDGTIMLTYDYAYKTNLGLAVFTDMNLRVQQNKENNEQIRNTVNNL